MINLNDCLNLSIKKEKKIKIQQFLKYFTLLPGINAENWIQTMVVKNQTTINNSLIFPI